VGLAHAAAALVLLATVGGYVAWQALAGDPPRPVTVIAVEPRGQVEELAAEVSEQLEQARDRGADVALTAVRNGRAATRHTDSFFCEPGSNPRRCEQRRAEAADRADAALAELLALAPPDRVDAFAAFRATADYLDTQPADGPVRLVAHLTGRHDRGETALNEPGLAEQADQLVEQVRAAELMPRRCEGWQVHLVAPTTGQPAADRARADVFRRLLADCGGELANDRRPQTTAGASDPPADPAESEPTRQTHTLDKALFDVDSAELRASPRAVIARIADQLPQPRQAHIEVHGYADHTGGDAHNQALSRERAEAVRTALAGHLDIDADTITVHAHGSSLPRADSDQGRQANRRVEIVVTHPSSPPD
jgi:outer membrane protein OmpA-like peptidoglycan-associated protein